MYRYLPSKQPHKWFEGRTSQVIICDHHFACLVAPYPIRCGVVVLIIGKLDALEQPFGGPLLGDGFASD